MAISTVIDTIIISVFNGPNTVQSLSGTRRGKTFHHCLWLPCKREAGVGQCLNILILCISVIPDISFTRPARFQHEAIFLLRYWRRFGKSYHYIYKCIINSYCSQSQPFDVCVWQMNLQIVRAIAANKKSNACILYKPLLPQCLSIFRPVLIKKLI